LNFIAVYKRRYVKCKWCGVHESEDGDYPTTNWRITMSLARCRPERPGYATRSVSR